jgi:hypothetical protein
MAYLAIGRCQHQCCLVCAQSLSIKVEGNINGSRFARSDVEHLLTQGVERRIARHCIELQCRRTRIDELERLGSVATANAVVNRLHSASVVTHQQVRGIHIDTSTGNAVNAKAIARDKAETVVASR